jgi:hypothetical protein
VLAAYVLPAVALWLLIGAVTSVLPLSGPAVVLAAGYALVYGGTEAAGRLWPAAPGRTWQVPQPMVIGASPRRRLLVWGSILGPGFLTRNPYAGFGLLPLAVAAAGSGGLVLAGAVGAAHGSGRALALLHANRSGPADDPMRLLLRSAAWRMTDGLILLVVAGAAVMTCVFRFA